MYKTRETKREMWKKSSTICMKKHTWGVGKREKMKKNEKKMQTSWQKKKNRRIKTSQTERESPQGRNKRGRLMEEKDIDRCVINCREE